MHIEPGLIDGPKIAFSLLTGGTAAAYGLSLAHDMIRRGQIARLAGGTLATTAAVLAFFQVLPHPPVGVSEVHLILGSSLFLLFGPAAAALGLALGLLAQGLAFAPTDLPQYGANLTTLLVPLFAMTTLARRIIPADTPYTALRSRQVLALSATFQAGIVAWVAFWAFYGQGISATILASVTSFGGAYMLVVLVEPLADLALLGAARRLRGRLPLRLFSPRLFAA
jgi:ABC-type Co2+ transport system permease subunit